MRDAKQKDIFRDISSKKAWSCGVRKITFNNTFFKQETTIDFNPILNFLVGPNGVGKTRLLKIIYEKVSNIAKENSGVEIEYFGDNENKEVIFVNSADIVETYRKYFGKIINLEDDLLNGLSSLEYSANDLDEARWLVFKNYEYIKVFEVEPFLKIESSHDKDDDDYSEDVLPFFVVRVGDVVYDSRTMGSGEYAALYIHWFLKRLDDNSLIFLEEPETFLSFKVQHNISVLFAKYAFEKKSSFLISTHSYPMIRNYADVFIKSLLFSGEKIKFGSHDKTLMYDNIGAFFDSFKYLFVCEDYFSFICFSFFLKSYFPQEFNRAKIFWCNQFKDHPGGATGLIKSYISLKSLKGLDSRLILVFDGDQKNEKGTFLNDDVNISDKLIFPEDEDMELVLVGFLKENLKSIDIDGFEDAFHDSCGQDKHEIFNSIAQKCTESNLNSIVRTCYSLYLKNNSNIVDYWKKEIESIFR